VLFSSELVQSIPLSPEILELDMVFTDDNALKFPLYSDVFMTWHNCGQRYVTEV
jgi:hypothetical protein